MNTGRKSRSGPPCDAILPLTGIYPFLRHRGFCHWQPPEEIGSEEPARFVGDLVPYLKKLYISPEADLIEVHRGG